MHRVDHVLHMLLSWACITVALLAVVGLAQHFLHLLP